MYIRDILISCISPFRVLEVHLTSPRTDQKQFEFSDILAEESVEKAACRMGEFDVSDGLWQFTREPRLEVAFTEISNNIHMSIPILPGPQE